MTSSHMTMLHWRICSVANFKQYRYT